MEVRLLRKEERTLATGLSYFVFDNYLRKRMAFAQTISFVEQYAKEVLQLKRVTINANPAWTYTYFLKQGFFTQQKNPYTNVSFIPMYAETADAQIFHKKYVSGKVHVLLIGGCMVGITLLGIGFMVGYMF